MQLRQLVLAAVTIVQTNALVSPVTRNGSTLMVGGKEWKAVGANVYWLGLDENVVPPEGEPFDEATNSSYPTKGRITDVMATVKALGGTMIRAHTLGVSTGNPLSLMPEAGVINEEAFEAIDWAVYQAGLSDIRLLVPLTDNYDYYHGGKFDFLRWSGFNLTREKDENNPEVQQFYTNSTVIALFKDYIQKLVTHRNHYNNLTYAEDPTIFAYETGNELLGPVWGDMNCPASWVQEIAQFVKSLAPSKLVVDGTYGVNMTHLGIDEIDVLSDHYPDDVTNILADIEAVRDAGKVYFTGEYAWNARGNSMQHLFDILEQTPGVIGDSFWSLFSRNMPDCNTWVDHADGLTMQYGNPANSDFINNQIKLVRRHMVAMTTGEKIDADAALPEVPCSEDRGLDV